MGTHRQGGFFDPYGHLWLAGDKSPLRRPGGEDPGGGVGSGPGRS
ncbi:hypothetical protein [Actinoplanes sp. NPDC049599]